MYMENYTEERTMKNVVEICGTIDSEFEYDHKVYGEAFYRTKIRVQRLSGEYDNIPIIMSERLIFDITPPLKDKKIYIEGELRSTFRREEAKAYVYMYLLKKFILYLKNNKM